MDRLFTILGVVFTLATVVLALYIVDTIQLPIIWAAVLLWFWAMSTVSLGYVSYQIVGEGEEEETDPEED